MALPYLDAAIRETKTVIISPLLIFPRLLKLVVGTVQLPSSTSVSAKVY
jgi:hypothetical protein